MTVTVGTRSVRVSTAEVGHEERGSDLVGQGAGDGGDRDALLPGEADSGSAEPGGEGADGQALVEPAVRAAQGDPDAEPGADAGQRVFVAAGLGRQAGRVTQVESVEDLLNALTGVRPRLPED